MSRELSSTTKKIIAVVLFFGILGFIIQIIGVVRRDDKVEEIKTEKTETTEEIHGSIHHTFSVVS